MPRARWNGPFDARLADGSWLRVGDTLDVTDRQLQSAHWQPVDSPAAAKTTPAPAAKTSEGGDD